MVLDTPTATTAMSNQQEHRDASLKTVAQNTDSNQHDEEELRHESPPQRRSSSYRILGTFTPHVDEDAAEAEQEEDPMAWADLEAFGGTKKTLEKKRPPRKLTADEVREQLRELHEIDSKMQEAVVQTKAASGMVDTIAWLKKHQEEAALQAERSDKRKRPLKRSTSFVRSVLDFFRGHSNSDLAHATDNQVQAQDKRVEEEETVATETSSLESPWGQETLHADWTEVGFALLNQGVLEDIARVRPVITSGELQGASPQAMIALSKWLWHFDEHVDHVATLKQYLLDERTIIAGVGYRVTTLYDTYKAALRASLAATHGDSADLSRLILEMFDHLELTLKDELVAVKDVVAQTLTEAQEYEALSTLFQSLEDDAECCVIVAKLLGFMKNHMPQEETDAFLALFDRDMKDKLAGEWMRHYATYLQLLDDFSVSFEGSRAYFT